MGNYLRQAGSLAFILGVLAIGLNFFDMVPKVLVWIYMWGEMAAWAIKIGLIFVGAGLYLLGAKLSPEDSSDDEE